MNTITMQRMTAIFNEWAKRFADDPNAFGAILDANGRPVSDYGECCAIYFTRIAGEMDSADLLPKLSAL